jgi:7-cyano-7-deazaguanine reductase
MTEYEHLTLLGQHALQPTSPSQAVLERVANPAAGKHYLIRLTCPEFTSLCPLTGQPDFAHIMIDYIPSGWIVESKSFKLLMGSYRNHGSFHEACTMEIAGACVAAYWGVLVSQRRHSDRRVLANRERPGRRLGSRTGRTVIPRAWLKLCPRTPEFESA